MLQGEHRLCAGGHQRILRPGAHGVSVAAEEAVLMNTSSNPLQALLATRGVVLLDGALATELERRGADLNDSLWSARLLIERPELIREVHRDYFLAGADVATTA